MEKKFNGIFLTELNFIIFIFNIFFLRKKYCVIRTYSYVFNHGSFLQKIVDILHKKNLIKLKDDFSDEIPYHDTGDCKRLTDVFAVSEDWMNSYFNFHKYGYYQNAVTHIISNRSYNLYEECIDLFWLSKKVLIPSSDHLHRLFFDYRYKLKINKNYWEYLTKYLLNFSLFMLSNFHFLYWFFTHIKFFYKKEKFRLAVDYVGGYRDSIFWDYINPKKEETLVVVRDLYTKNNFKECISNYKVVSDDSGVFGFFLAIKFLYIFIQDSILIFLKSINLPPDYYRQICFLPYKKIKYKAFFNKYKCSFFWGRDDYNHQHIIRSSELRKEGGISMGCNHGIESINSLAFQLRQIDFDYYYMHGLFQYIKTYKKYWPQKMIVKGIGSLFSNPKQHKRIHQGNGKNVAIIVAPSFHQDSIFKCIIKLAENFPDLIFWISTKAKHRTQSGDFSNKYQNLLKRKRNIKENVDDVYNLIADCKYVFSESSTLLAEAVFFDKVALCFDPEPEKFKYLYYRNFPELVFKDTKSIIKKIRNTISKNNNFYSNSDLSLLINKTKFHPWQIIKSDMDSIINNEKN